MGEERRSTDEGAAARTRPSSFAGSVDDAVDDNPWVQRLTRWGWIAKSVVYTLMGLTAVQIARQSAPDDDASPEGSIGRVANAPFGRVVLVVLAVGLVLYSAWRLIGVATIRGSAVSDWAERVGYTFSGLFYVVLAWTAGKAAVTGVDPEKPNSIERISTSLLEVTAGRWLLGLVGLGAIAVGLYFVVHQGVQRSFTDELDGVSPSPGDNEPKRRALLVSGVIGWVGRGIVTVLVGYFIVRAAVRFDPDEAHGFDQTLREVAGTTLGSILVLVCAVGLVAHGIFCFLSHRFRSL